MDNNIFESKCQEIFSKLYELCLTTTIISKDLGNINVKNSNIDDIYDEYIKLIRDNKDVCDIIDSYFENDIIDADKKDILSKLENDFNVKIIDETKYPLAYWYENIILLFQFITKADNIARDVNIFIDMHKDNLFPSNLNSIDISDSDDILNEYNKFTTELSGKVSGFNSLFDLQSLNEAKLEFNDIDQKLCIEGPGFKKEIPTINITLYSQLKGNITTNNNSDYESKYNNLYDNHKQCMLDIESILGNFPNIDLADLEKIRTSVKNVNQQFYSLITRDKDFKKWFKNNDKADEFFDFKILTDKYPHLIDSRHFGNDENTLFDIVNALIDLLKIKDIDIQKCFEDPKILSILRKQKEFDDKFEINEKTPLFKDDYDVNNGIDDKKLSTLLKNIDILGVYYANDSSLSFNKPGFTGFDVMYKKGKIEVISHLPGISNFTKELFNDEWIDSCNLRYEYKENKNKKQANFDANDGHKVNRNSLDIKGLQAFIIQLNDMIMSNEFDDNTKKNLKDMLSHLDQFYIPDQNKDKSIWFKTMFNKQVTTYHVMLSPEVFEKVKDYFFLLDCFETTESYTMYPEEREQGESIGSYEDYLDEFYEQTAKEYRQKDYLKNKRKKYPHEDNENGNHPEFTNYYENEYSSLFKKNKLVFGSLNNNNKIGKSFRKKVTKVEKEKDVGFFKKIKMGYNTFNEYFSHNSSYKKVGDFLKSIPNIIAYGALEHLKIALPILAATLFATYIAAGLTLGFGSTLAKYALGGEFALSLIILAYLLDKHKKKKKKGIDEDVDSIDDSIDTDSNDVAQTIDIDNLSDGLSEEDRLKLLLERYKDFMNADGDYFRELQNFDLNSELGEAVDFEALENAKVACYNYGSVFFNMLFDVDSNAKNNDGSVLKR